METVIAEFTIRHNLGFGTWIDVEFDPRHNARVISSTKLKRRKTFTALVPADEEEFSATLTIINKRRGIYETLTGYLKPNKIHTISIK